MAEAKQTAPLPLGVTAVMLPELGFEQQIALCAELGITHYVYRPRTIPEHARDQPYSNWGNHKFDLTPARLLKEGPQLKQMLEQAGLIPYATVPDLTAASDETDQRLNFEAAAAGGARSVRLAPPPYPRSDLFDYTAYLDDAIRAYEQSIAWAQAVGIKPVIEMHAGHAAISPGLALNLVQRFAPTQIGLILDLPNFAIEGGVRPNLCLSVVRPYVDHCHLGGARSRASGHDAYGFRVPSHEMCPLTQSDQPIARWVALLAQLGPVPLIIEDYTANLPGQLRLRQTVQAIQRLPEVAKP